MEAQNERIPTEVLTALPKRLRQALLLLPQHLADTLMELRLRAGQPLVLVTPQNNWFMTAGGKPTCMCQGSLLRVTQTEIGEIVAHACGYSVHSHQDDFSNGFLTLPGGHRIGLCGTAVVGSGTLTGIRQITSLNIRIARDIPNAAQETLRTCFQSGLCNLLLAGAPMSGKTTILRALVKALSEGYTGKLQKCVVIDERFELASGGAANGGNSSTETAFCNADVLSGYSKADGIKTAVRALAPDMIFCDEIGSSEDALAISEGIRCGVHFTATAHARDMADLKRRRQISRLLEERAFDTVIFLDTGENVGRICRVVRVGEQDAQNGGIAADPGLLRMDGRVYVGAGA